MLERILVSGCSFKRVKGRIAIMEITYRDAHFCCWGAASQGGVYLLRLNVSQPVAVQFGRFQNGRLFLVPPGDYLYVGSALGQKGSASLARRLLRHASRGDAHRPHPVRQEMLTLFPQIGTHLLRVTAVSPWWSTFPEQLTCFLQDIFA